MRQFATAVQGLVARVARGVAASDLMPYALGLGLNLLALGLSILLSGGSHELGFLFFGAVVGLATWYGGAEAGITTILLSIIFTPELRGWHEIDVRTPAGQQTYLRFVTFIATESVIALLVGAARANQDALQRSESKFRAVADTASSAIFIFDFESMLWANEATEQITGYSREELLANSVWMTVHPESVPKLQERMDRRRRGEPVEGRVELRIQRKNGESRWIEFDSRPILFGPHQAYLAVAFDVTDRRRNQMLQEAMLRITESVSFSQDLRQFYATIHKIVSGLLDARNFYIALWDDDKKTIIFPYFVDEHRREAPPRRPQAGLTEYVLQTGEPLMVTSERLRELHATGKVKPVGVAPEHWLGAPLVNASGVFGMVGVQNYRKDAPLGEAELRILQILSSQIATAMLRKRDQESVRDSERRYRTLVQSAVSGIYRSVEERRFLEVNEALLKMLGCASVSDALVLDLARDVYLSADEHAEVLRLLRAHGQVDGLQVQWRRRDGGSIVAKLSGRAWPDARGELQCEIIAEDVTERHNLEQQLRQSQKMEAIGRLAGGVAHDFNNLLTIMQGYGYLALDELRRSGMDSAREKVEEMTKAADRAALLTRQLLAFSRRQMVTTTVLDANDVVANIENLLHRLLGEQVRVHIRRSVQPALVKADKGQLEQIVMNLAINARDAMPRGGDLTIQVENVDLAPTTQGGRSMGNKPYTVITVRDTGVGMTEAVRARIFEPFFTTKEQGKGTGLGLSTVYGIVSQAGGHISVDTKVGNGSTFRVFLPRPEEAAAPRVEAPVVAIPRRRDTVMVVEDEDSVRSLVKLVLEREGYYVLIAGGPEAALRICRDENTEIDLLLTDVVLAQSSGRELAEELLRQRPKMKVLYMSGYTDDAVLHHGVRHSDAGFLQKPFTPTVLLEKVTKALRRDAPPTQAVM